VEDWNGSGYQTVCQLSLREGYEVGVVQEGLSGVSGLRECVEAECDENDQAVRDWHEYSYIHKLQGMDE
jgi:hypothetical protein